ncbi:MAG: 2OG-Fe(II) oxygenase family protein [Pseudomonadota bacterium]
MAQEEIRILPLFPTFVWYLDLAPEKVTAINAPISSRLDAMIAAKTDHVLGQRLQTDQNLHTDPALGGLLPQIAGATRSALDFLKIRYRQFDITGCWANVSWPGTPHKEHCHPNNYLSGVYYVEVPPGGDNITFHDPRVQPNLFMPPTREQNTENAGKMTIGVKAGTLVLFPSWLVHSVQPFQGSSSTRRVSIAFNIMFSDFERDVSPPLWEGNLKAPD